MDSLYFKIINVKWRDQILVKCLFTIFHFILTIIIIKLYFKPYLRFKFQIKKYFFK